MNRSQRERVAETNNGVPPFGHSTQLRVFVDPDLLQYDEVWAAAGTWNDVFGAAPVDIVRVAGASSPTSSAPEIRDLKVDEARDARSHIAANPNGIRVIG